MPEVKIPRGMPVDKAIRMLRRKMNIESVMDEYKARQAYVKPCEARRRAAGLVR